MKILVVIRLVVLMAVIRSAQGLSDICTSADTVRIEDKCIRLFEATLTWTDAKAACEEIGPTVSLVSVTSEAVREYIQNKTIALGRRAWLDGSDAGHEGRWVWSFTGQDADIDPSWWDRGQPDNFRGSEDKLIMKPNGKLNDYPDSIRLPYFCQSTEAVQTCSEGWFGSKCQFKCRCVLGCNSDGSCVSGPCWMGYFGPECQHVNLPRWYDRGPFWIRDENNSTCNPNPSSQRVSLNMTVRHPINWIRLQSKGATVASLSEIKVEIGTDSGELHECVHKKFYDIADEVLDVYCEQDAYVNKVVFTGPGVGHLCNVFVDGGRSIAIKQDTAQSSTSQPERDSSKAVDGDTFASMKLNSCTQTDASDPAPNWNLTLSKPAAVYRYELSNRDDWCQDCKKGLQGFILTSFGTTRREEFQHQDTEATPRRSYMFAPGALTSPISHVNIKATHVNDEGKVILTLCEVQLFGDSLCQPGRYGRECELKCHCRDKESCHPATGACPRDCDDGWSGYACDQVSGSPA